MATCCLCSKEINDNKYHQLGSISVCIGCYIEFSENMKKIGNLSHKKPFTTSVSENKIETVYFNQVTEICRLKVIGGWLVTSSFVGGSSAISSNIGGGFSTCFVPDPGHEWVIT